MLKKQCHKVWRWSIEKYSSYRADKVLQSLVIELGRGILPTNILTKYDDYTMKTNEVIERTNALDAVHRMFP